MITIRILMESRQKSIKVIFKILTDINVPVDWDDYMVDFWITESYCRDNILKKLTSELSEANENGTCTSCYRSMCERVDNDFKFDDL
jgi:hypothetical protein